MTRTLALAFAVAALAHAASAADGRRLTAAYDDLDFAKPVDVETFSKRLEALARDACAGRPAVQLVGNERVSCRKQVRARALAQLPAERRAALLAGGKATITVADR